jgi:porphobilinogen synthase
MTLSMIERPRRIRQSASLRSMTEETLLKPQHLVAPLFVLEGSQIRLPIHSLPGVERLTIDHLLHEIEVLLKLGVRAVDLFPYIPKEKRDLIGSESLLNDNLTAQTVRAIKNRFPELCVMVDIALDPYTTHGHDGLLAEDGSVDNDSTVEALCRMSLHVAEAGADVVAPSDMMDGRVGAIRKALDLEGFKHVAILSYAAKYASALYGPFRDALDSAPQFGDKKGYQMNPANAREALREALLDEKEGADILLVKPALSYLDIIAKIRAQSNLPIAAYHVSGEYAMVMAAHEKGWLNADRIFHEQFLSIRRAGADFILTYAAKRLLQSLQFST